MQDAELRTRVSQVSTQTAFSRHTRESSIAELSVHIVDHVSAAQIPDWTSDVRMLRFSRHKRCQPMRNRASLHSANMKDYEQGTA